jgi:hypothetical protein
MKPLSKDITHRGFRYRQVAREGDVAVYSQSFVGGNRIFAYEVIIIGSHDHIEIMGKHVDPAETYPAEGQWGKKGFTISGYPDNLSVALARMREIIAERSVKMPRKVDSAIDSIGQDN